MSEIIDLILHILSSAAVFYAVFLLVKQVQDQFASNPLRDFLSLQDDVSTPGWGERTGARIASHLPISLNVWEDHLRWAQLGGKFQGWTIGKVVFFSMLLGVSGVLIPLHNPAPASWLVPFITASLPFVRVRSIAIRARKRTARMLPELAALVAAELSANVSPEKALERAANLPGSLASLLSDALALSRRTGQPLLTHDRQGGTLREIFANAGVPSLRAFAVQLDLAAQKGVEVPQRMVEISSMLAAEHKQQLMENAEKLETNLTTAVAVFYFAPMILIILLPMFGEIIKAI